VGERIHALGVPTVVVQEGGYEVDAIGIALEAFRGLRACDGVNQGVHMTTLNIDGQRLWQSLMDLAAIGARRATRGWH
jgi:acetoin utilization deacetylase AcuC-like enzyme